MLFDVYIFPNPESRCTHNIEEAVLVAEKENLDFIYKAYFESKEIVAFTYSGTKSVVFPTFRKRDTPPSEHGTINKIQALEYGLYVARIWYCLDRRWHNSEWKVSEKVFRDQNYFEVEIIFTNKRISPKRAVRCALNVYYYFTEVVDTVWDGDYKRTKFDLYQLSDQKSRNNLDLSSAIKIHASHDFESHRNLMLSQGNKIAMTLAGSKIIVFPVPESVASRYLAGKFHDKGLCRKYAEKVLRIWYSLSENSWINTNFSVSELNSILCEGYFIDHREVTLIFRKKESDTILACYAKVYWDYVEIVEMRELK